MTKQLNIRSDEAYRLAHKLAAEMGKPVAEAMLIVPLARLRCQATCRATS